ncbi:MAG: shikimate kinase AroK [Steroidobacteraceae bacterium]
MPGKPPNIFLIGPMGSGKSAVGRNLARLLRVPFYDSDAEIERRTGVDIPFIFDKEGESGFREREREVIASLTSLRHVVLSTGGGAVMLAGNRRLLAENGWVVYLQTSVAQQAERVKPGRQRPLLSGVEDPAQRLQELMQIRDPLYRSIADLTVSTDGRQIKAVVRDILQLIR